MQVSRRECLTIGGLSLVAAAAATAVSTSDGPVLTPEQFGATGDGKTNDTAAFAAMAAFVNAQGGGTVMLSPRTYIVGRQAYDRALGYAFAPASIMDFRGCSRTLTIRGNGARIRASDGLRYGTLNPATGRPTHHSSPSYAPGELASPYLAMIQVCDCVASVEISDLDLDGNAAGLQFGGPWGDSGWQIGCVGLMIKDNRGPVRVSRVNSHHHAQDGGSGDGPGRPGVPEQVTIEDCKFSSNGRNAWSMVGGVGWTFTRCVFERSARSLPFPGSAPKAGIDFEAEGGKYVSDIRLIDCVAEDNVGVGCLHPGSGKTSGVSWEGGRIVGTTTWSYRGGGNRNIAFKNTLFAGAVVNLAYESFEDCTFSDDVRRSLTGELYNPYGFIIPDPVATNHFVRCTVIHSKHGSSLNGNFDQPVFDNCAFYSKAAAGRLDVYGHFRGSNTRFIAEAGGTDFAVLPAGRGGTTSAGHAENSFSVTSNRGRTVTYPRG